MDLCRKVSVRPYQKTGYYQNKYLEIFNRLRKKPVMKKVILLDLRFRPTQIYWDVGCRQVYGIGKGCG